MKKVKKHMIFMNMSGLHSKIYTIHESKKQRKRTIFDTSPEMWYTWDGKLGANPRKRIDVRQGHATILFDDIGEARRAMEALLVYQDHIRRHL